jgi:hypothetical protein
LVAEDAVKIPTTLRRPHPCVTATSRGVSGARRLDDGRLEIAGRPGVVPITLQRDEHLLILQPSDEAAKAELVMILFGRLLYAIAIADAPPLENAPSWLLSPSRPSGRQPVPLDELANRIGG